MAHQAPGDFTSHTRTGEAIFRQGMLTKPHDALRHHSLPPQRAGALQRFARRDLASSVHVVLKAEFAEHPPHKELQCPAAQRQLREHKVVPDIADVPRNAVENRH